MSNIQLRNVTKRFDTVTLHNVNLEIEDGNSPSLLGSFRLW